MKASDFGFPRFGDDRGSAVVVHGFSQRDISEPLVVAVILERVGHGILYARRLGSVRILDSGINYEEAKVCVALRARADAVRIAEERDLNDKESADGE